VEGRRVLDVGCSQGIASILLAREGKTVWGVDREALAVESAKERLADEEEPVRNGSRCPVRLGAAR
jgi:2-polyprenyl-6-hydroxyphenyl methylase/3-demethylubiquinone-9 3-methyltransferase